MKIEAKTLEEAYEKAAETLHCSVADIEAEIIQYPSKGVFGLFAKSAIIEVEEYFEIEKLKNLIKKELTVLVKKSCFNIEVKEVSKYNEDTAFIKLDGEDAALLIGREGYRYNALNYMLYSWLHQKYGFKVRLEIAEFLKTQEEELKEYIEFFINEKIEPRGYGRTKAFNGVLLYMALDILREKLPDKYIGIKERNGEKYIIVGDKYENNSGNSDT